SAGCPAARRSDMNEPTNGRLTRSDRLTARLLRLAPWLAFLFVSLPAPLFFLWRYFTSTEDFAVWMLAALTALGVSAVFGLALAALLVLYRLRWQRQLRDRLATNGVTADELEWFRSELTRAERRTLKEMDARSPLLADAYRDTLAARLTATRVAAHAGRERVAIERRLQDAATLQSPDRTRLEADLRADRERLERIAREADEHRAEAEARLHMIEAAAGRGLSEDETARALARLDINKGQVPFALEAAREEQQAREEIDRLLRAGNARNSQTQREP
ncbi:MAG TPA: hypothetical protein VGV38_14250, partial [Pyrinomonadaceae bacterium]|nr:hypothetical protein [Pyrinomonadaceae bacterium]